MEQIIKKAVEGGFKFESLMYEYPSDRERIFLDPKFWQALGNVEVWKGNGFNKKPLWQNYWHCFIDHLAEGKDAESFFNNLLQ